ncbi:MAG: CBS domain-containing protein, partial [Thermoplasmata archaeon]|nr:CBS domain-containing protein [Thermoplasmata archaeon]
KIVHDLEPNVMQLFSVKDVMVQREDVVTIGPEDQLHKVVAIIRRTGHNGFPVLDDDKKLVGIVTHEDTRNAHNRGELFLKAKEFMTTDMVTVTPYQTGEEALRAMGDRRVSHLPVVDPYDKTKLLGWLSKGDLVFAYEDYHRRMDAPFCDDDGMVAVCDDDELTAEQVLPPPSLVDRIFGRRTKKTEKTKEDALKAGDIGSEGDDDEAFEVEIYESEAPKWR